MIASSHVKYAIHDCVMSGAMHVTSTLGTVLHNRLSKWTASFGCNHCSNMCHLQLHLYDISVLVQVRVRFNAEEAIEELQRLNLIHDVDQQRDEALHYAAIPPAEASEHLSVHWRQLLSHRVDGCIQHVA